MNLGAWPRRVSLADRGENNQWDETGSSISAGVLELQQRLESDLAAGEHPTRPGSLIR